VNEAGTIVRELPLLEGRSYLHGTTLFDAIMEFVPPGAQIVFTIPKRIDSNRVQFDIRVETGVLCATESARLVWKSAGSSGTVGVLPLPSSLAPRRDPYDEAIVSHAVRGDDLAVALDGPSPFTFVATLIPMFKMLLSRRVPPSSPGQWMFSRLDLDHVPQPFVPLRLVLDSIVGQALARSAIESRGDRVGLLYFSWVPKLVKVTV
jgi:hypothetical protein